MENSIKEKLFNGLNFKTILSNADFTEESVRAVIVDPLLKELGYGQSDIVRNKNLQLKVGSAQKAISLMPDYLLKAGEYFSFVLDAKSPSQNILDEGNINQAFSYAVHPQVNSKYFALCNGIDFALFRTSDIKTPIFYFKLEDIDENFERLKNYLSPQSFHSGKEAQYIRPQDEINGKTLAKSDDFDYSKRPLLREIAVKKRAAKRHFGVHGYFTRQTWNVVAAYINNFSAKGDIVLDSFGGSGVTVIEALLNGRKAINIDLNPFAVFIVSAILAPVDFSKLEESFNKIYDQYIKLEPKTKKQIEETLKKYPAFKNLPLPKGSDVRTVRDLFTAEQTAKLSLLKTLIKKEKDKNIRETLLLMFSGIIGRANITWYSVGGEFGGGESVFRYFRYRKAPKPSKLDIAKYFLLRYKRIVAAKKEIAALCLLNRTTIENVYSDAQIIKGTASDLSFIENESVDYIYTDPPYGKKIPYLDLSAMWNAWLDLKVSEKDYEEEAIEGGQHNKTKQEYNDLIAKSIKEMYRVLKFDRWLSFVFAHKDPEFWHLIINTAESCGFEYVGATAQKNGQSSFKKRQNPFTVLSGQLIINFKKTKNPKAIMAANLGMDTLQIVTQTIEGIIAANNGATIEQINDELIIKGLELGFLHLLKKEYSDLTPILMENFNYDERSKTFQIKEASKFKTKIDVKLRIRYYLISYLRQMEREGKNADFDEIYKNIIPLLLNGDTPPDQTVLNVLETIAERTSGGWKLKTEGQQEML